MRTLIIASFLLFSAASTEADVRSSVTRASMSPAFTPLNTRGDAVSCDQGIRFDDNTFEDGYGWADSVLYGQYAMRLALGPGRKQITRICVRWSEFLADDQTLDYDLRVLAADGAGGSPGRELGKWEEISVSLPNGGGWAVFDLTPPLVTDEEFVFVAAGWLPIFDNGWFVAADENGPGGQPGYARLTTGPWSRIGPGGVAIPEYRSLGLRIETEAVTDPEPPNGPWLSTSALPGFRAKVKITTGSSSLLGGLVPAVDCIVDTLCVSGAVAGRPEVFLRVVGPKPNGFLWPTITKFTTSQVEIWVEQLATGARQYYLLTGASAESSDLLGLFDREGFRP